MNINIILLAKLKNPCMAGLIDEYLKRFSGSWNVKYSERKKIPFKEKKENSIYVILDEKGERISSKKLAAYFTKWSGYRTINFFIGGSYGFSQEDYNSADKIISLSDLTFPHGFVPLILTEQIYRAYTINNNHPYHH